MRALRAGGALGVLLAGLAVPGLALGQCTISGGDFVSAEPGQPVQLSFQVGEVSPSSCTGATGAITFTDGTGGATVEPSAWSSGLGTVFFTVTPGPNRGNVVDVQVSCPSCGNQNLFYTVFVSDDLQLAYVEPPGGLLQAAPGDTVNLTVELTRNGALSNEDTVCWEITSNPAGDAVLGPADTFCGGAKAGAQASAKGFVIGSQVGTFVTADNPGIATVPLQVGSASNSPVQVLVYPQADPAEMLVIQVATVPTLQAVTSSPIAATTGVPFDVQVRMVEITGAGAAGKSIDFSSSDGSISPASATVLTDNAGNAVVSFTPTQAGSFPSVISASYDPTPTAPGSGDEQLQQFTVNVTDPPPTLSAVTASPIATTTGQAFDVTARLTGFSGTPVSGATITFASSDASITPASASIATDANGDATASFTATQAGSFPASISASYDPTPASPGSGDEQAVSWTVNATDPPATGELRKPPTGSGDGQAGAPGAVLQLAAQAMSDGVPEAGVLVQWSVVSGDASLAPSSSTTDGQGLARTSVTLGASTGSVTIQAVRADNTDAVVLYTLNTIVVDQLTIVSGQQQQAQAGAEGEPLVVRFTRNGSPLAGIDVSFQVLSGDATVTPAVAVTGNNGEASTGISFGPEGGEVVVQASAGNAQPVTFRFSVPGGSGPPPTGLTLELVSGDNQVGAVGTRAPMPLVVVARDQDGDPLANVPVGWRVLSGSAQLDAVEVLTDDEGRAEIGFRFGSSAGPVLIRANAYSDLVFVDFSAEAVVPTLSIVSGNQQQGNVGEALAQDFVVQVGATAGSLQGVVVTWTVLDGGGSLQSASSTTDASGQARNRLTLGPEAGQQRVRAQVAGGSQVEFTATATGGDGELQPISGGGQTLPTGSPSAPLVVEYRDAAGNPIVGATLVWTGENAALEQSSTVTDAQGRSSNRATVELPGAATVRVEAQLDGDAFAVFAINGGVVNTAGLDEEQLQVADAIDNLCPALAAIANRTPAQQDLLDRCMELADSAGDDPQGVADALDELLQDVSLTQVHAALMITSAQFDNLKARIAAIRSGERGFSIAGLNVAGSGGSMPLSLLQEDDAAEVGADFGRWGFFASGTIGRGEADASNGAPRYDYDTSGLTAGVDYRFSDRWIFGAAIGYARQDTELTGDQGEVGTTGFSLSAYSTWFNANSWYFDGVLTWGSSEYELARRIRYTIERADGGTTSIDQLANADSDGSQFSGALSFGRDFQRGAWSLGPYFRGTWTRVEFDDYSEQLNANLPGAGLAMSVDARDIESMTAVLGAKATYIMSRDWGILMPHASFEWEHEFEDDAQAVVARFLHDPTATPITVGGLPIDSDYYNLGIGLSAVFAGGKSGFVYYEHLLGADGLEHGNLAIGIRIEF